MGIQLSQVTVKMIAPDTFVTRSFQLKHLNLVVSQRLSNWTKWLHFP